MPKIAVMKESEVLWEWPLEDKEVMIGRGDDCHIVLQDSLVSWHHAKIVKAYGSYLIEDLRSTNGVTINGRSVTKQILKLGDKARIGSYDLCLNKSIGDKYNEPEKTMMADSVSSASSYKQGTRTAKIRFLTGSDSGLTLPVITFPYTIDKPGNLATISRRGEVYTFQKISGKSVALNGNQVSSVGSDLKDGDRIKVGEEEMRFLIE